MASNEEVGLRIESRRKSLGLTLEDVANAVGVTKSTIQRYEKGKIANLKQPVVEAIAAVLGTTSGWLRGDTSFLELVAINNGMKNAMQLFEDSRRNPAVEYPHLKNILPLPRFTQKPRLGTIACGKPILAVGEAEEFDDVPDGVHCDFTLKCQGDSMINARIFDGDIVYIRSQPEVDNGEIAAVRIGDEATLKKVYYTPGSDRITLRACNPMYPDLEYDGNALDEIEVLGKAVGFTSTIR